MMSATIIGNVYICGPQAAIESLANSIDCQKLTVKPATRASRDLWYLEYPSFRFDPLRISECLYAYLDEHAGALRMTRPNDIELSVLSLRLYPGDDGTYNGFYLDEALVDKLSELDLSFDCNIDSFRSEDIPEWN